MSFRAKIGIGFSGVLLLTIAIALTNWWGIGSAIQSQENLYRTAAEIERSLYQLMHEEQAYQNSGRIEFARAVNTLLKGIRDQIEMPLVYEAVSQGADPAAIQNSLQRYEASFLEYQSTTISMQAMKSRMLKESQQLLVYAQSLAERDDLASSPVSPPLESTSGSELLQTFEQRIGAEIAFLTSAALLSEKKFILNQADTAITAVNELINRIILLADQHRQSQASSASGLEAFRISRVASIYLENFNRYAAELARLNTSKTTMQDNLDQFATSLISYLAAERAKTTKRIDQLQTISLTITCAALIFGIIAVLILSNLVTRPISELKESAQHIVDGNLDTQVGISGSDDIGELGQLFNQMTERLRKSFKKIENYRDHLEALVKVRTENLEREVAERKSAEEALRTSRERLAHIIDQSPIGIAIYDQNFHITDWNPSCEKIFGFSRAEVLGQPAHIIIPEDTQDLVNDIFHTILKTQQSLRSQNDNLTKDGKVITCEWYNTPLTDQTDRVTGMLSLVENVTDKLRMEQELLKMKKLESTGVLAGGIAHDFNNILTAILGNINLALHHELLPTDTRNTLAAAERATIRAQSLTQQLLTFAKGGEPVKEQTSIIDVIKDSATFVLHGSSTTCTYAFPENLWLIEADKGQLSQVIQNIVLNASQAMPGGGIVQISGENVDKDGRLPGILDPEKGYVRITIADEGIGIPHSVLERIFDPYFTTKKQGSGLGLAITLSIINKHDGYISVNSQPDFGTVFTMYLPASEQTAKQIKTRRAERGESDAARILVMDDDPMVIHVAANMLEALGHEVVTASDGVECIRIYQEQLASDAPPDLVIMDLTIPGGMGGEEAVKELLAITPDLPVIVSSGYSNDPIMSAYSDYGFCAALAKPYIIESLRDIIHTTLHETTHSGT